METSRKHADMQYHICSTSCGLKKSRNIYGQIIEKYISQVIQMQYVGIYI